MRSVFAILLLSVCLPQAGFTQGIKDPPNYPLAQNQPSKPTAVQAASRPTTVKNYATGTLPTGVAAQSVWKDGKLTTIPRQ